MKENSRTGRRLIRIDQVNNEPLQRRTEMAC
jgi:hypothetical protein